MKISDLISELQAIEDRQGESNVVIANDNNNILDSWEIDRVCFFKDGEHQEAILVVE